MFLQVFSIASTSSTSSTSACGMFDFFIVFFIWTRLLAATQEPAREERKRGREEERVQHQEMREWEERILLCGVSFVRGNSDMTSTSHTCSKECWVTLQKCWVLSSVFTQLLVHLGQTRHQQHQPSVLLKLRTSRLFFTPFLSARTLLLPLLFSIPFSILSLISALRSFSPRVWMVVWAHSCKFDWLLVAFSLLVPGPLG